MKCLILSVLLFGLCSAIERKGINCGTNMPTSCRGVRTRVSLHDGCNVCFCASGTSGMACSRMACRLPQSYAEDAYCDAVRKENEHKMKVASSRISCGLKTSCEGVKRAVTVTDGCNNCRCAPGYKVPACTRMRCPAPKSDDEKAFCASVQSDNEHAIRKAS